MGRAWTGAGSLNHLTIYSPVILSYEVEDPVNTVGGAILSVHLLAAPFTQDHRYCPEQGVSYCSPTLLLISLEKNGSMGIRSLRVQPPRWMLIDSFRQCVVDFKPSQNYQSRCSFAGLLAAAILSQLDSLVTEPDLIQVNRIRLLLAVPVHLVVDCHSVPGSRAWVIEPVHSAGDSVQGDALELQAIVRSP